MYWESVAKSPQPLAFSISTLFTMFDPHQKKHTRQAPSHILSLWQIYFRYFPLSSWTNRTCIKPSHIGPFCPSIQFGTYVLDASHPVPHPRHTWPHGQPCPMWIHQSATLWKRRGIGWGEKLLGRKEIYALSESLLGKKETHDLSELYPYNANLLPHQDSRIWYRLWLFLFGKAKKTLLRPRSMFTNYSTSKAAAYSITQRL